MGQYYKAAFLKDKEPKGSQDLEAHFESWSHQDAYKRDDGSVYVGGQGSKLMEHSYIGNVFVSAVEKELAKSPKRLVWAGDYADDEPGVQVECDGEVSDANIYHLCTEDTEVKPKAKICKSIGKRHRYIVNLDKGVFVDKNKCPEIPGWPNAYVHPLPLLTCEGNGRGGGDYRANHPLVGTWARDRIAVVTRKPKGIQEIVPNFQE